MTALATLNTKINRPVTDLRDWSARIRSHGAVENWLTFVTSKSYVAPTTGFRNVLPRVGTGEAKATGAIAWATEGAYQVPKWNGAVAEGKFRIPLSRPDNQKVSIIIGGRARLDRTNFATILTNGAVSLPLFHSWNGNPAFSVSGIVRFGAASTPLGSRFLYGFTFDWSTGGAAAAVNGGAFSKLTQVLTVGTPAAPLELMVGGSPTETYTGEIHEVLTLPGVDLSETPALWSDINTYATTIWGA